MIYVKRVCTSGHTYLLYVSNRSVSSRSASITALSTSTLNLTTVTLSTKTFLTKSQINRLQQIQNCLARTVARAP